MKNGSYIIETDKETLKVLLSVIKYGEHAYRMDKNSKRKGMNTVKEIIEKLENCICG